MNMKASEIFGLIIRCAGLALVLAGLRAVYSAILVMSGGGISNSHTLFLYGIPYTLLGIWFLSGAKQLVGFCYSEENKKSE